MDLQILLSLGFYKLDRCHVPLCQLYQGWHAVEQNSQYKYIGTLPKFSVYVLLGVKVWSSTGQCESCKYNWTMPSSHSSCTFDGQSCFLSWTMPSSLHRNIYIDSQNPKFYTSRLKKSWVYINLNFKLKSLKNYYFPISWIFLRRNNGFTNLQIKAKT